MTFPLSDRSWLPIGLALAASITSAPVCRGEEEPKSRQWLPATPQRLPRWRGFNLTEKLRVDTKKPFLEEDFRLISQLGFDFVRLPMDYRIWVAGDDWTKFNEAALREIDQAVAWGEKYGLHVQINFHRAPGYVISTPKEERDLWTDPEAQRVFALHWAAFARRYKGIPNERLSFDLVNEPSGVTAQQYVAAVRPVIDAIRREDPNRLIVSDGIDTGRQPVLELASLQVAQSTRGYLPSQVSHYQASWIQDSDKQPLPSWPAQVVPSGTLCSPHKADWKPEARGPLVIEGPFAAATTLRLHALTVSSRAHLVVRADGKPVWEHAFVCGPGEGEWKEARYREQWKIWANLYDRDYEVPVPAGTKRIEVQVADGDWMELGELGIRRPDGGEDVLRLAGTRNAEPAGVRYRPGWPEGAFTSLRLLDRDWLLATAIRPWKEAEAKGIGVMVGEWGAYNRTPHAVALAWMDDCLRNWQEAGWGWALWNFRGPFGILDSGRKDVTYEEWEGHKLDRKMLELLQRY